MLSRGNGRARGRSKTNWRASALDAHTRHHMRVRGRQSRKQRELLLCASARSVRTVTSLATQIGRRFPSSIGKRGVRILLPGIARTRGKIHRSCNDVIVAPSIGKFSLTDREAFPWRSATPHPKVQCPRQPRRGTGCKCQTSRKSKQPDVFVHHLGGMTALVLQTGTTDRMQ